jgi:hypothetical protein
MVEIRVSVPDAAGAHGLLRRLSVVFDRSSVFYDGSREEVRVRADWESRAVVQVIDAVEAWLEETGAPSAELWMGARSYTVAGQVPITSAA